MLDADFFEWLRKEGAFIASIESGLVAEGFRGVIAKTDIDPGTLLVSVPERLLLSAHSAKKDTAFAQALSATNKQSTNSSQVLAAHLLHEVCKGQDSYWKPYLATLPRQYTCLSYFCPEDIQELQVAYAMDIAHSVAEALKSDHTSVKPLLSALGLPAKFMTLGAWRWATATVASRTMYLPDDDAGALMPFGDLHNHRSPPGVAPDLGILGEAQDPSDTQLDQGSSGSGQFDLKTRKYMLFAQTRYRAGEQVFLSYGAHTNLELLEHYGFVSEDNPYDTAQLPVIMLPEGLQGTVPLTATYLQRNGMPSWELLRDLRIWAASQLGCRQCCYLATEGKPISGPSEAHAFKILKAICQTLLQQLPTTADEDAALLQSQAVAGECKRLAVAWRLSHKRILQNCIDVASQVIETGGQT
ncbi:hypothetical protein WJX75_006775 [Coccomyxa subellipsoidea]|uniref:SET domain-containing protein n=1 Tax=Coccomyxa subellipsoidea TaxID=248742 RepID=A0ABR2YN51_9CHLO